MSKKFWNIAYVGGAAFGLVGVFVALIGWLSLIFMVEQAQKPGTEKDTR